MSLTIDPSRASTPKTSILVRARDPEWHWDNHDIAHLDEPSLDDWLRSRDDVEWPISVVKILLGHQDEN